MIDKLRVVGVMKNKHRGVSQLILLLFVSHKDPLVSIRIHIVMTTYPLGNPSSLPDYIKNNRYIIALEKDQNHAYRYNDHLCLFCCLAIGKFGKLAITVTKSQRTLSRLLQTFSVNPQDCKCVELTDFPQCEPFYKTNCLPCFLSMTVLLKLSTFPKPRFPPRFTSDY